MLEITKKANGDTIYINQTKFTRQLGLLILVLVIGLFLVSTGHQKYMGAGDGNPLGQMAGVKGMVLGGICLAAALFIVWSRILILFRGPTRLIVSDDKVVIEMGSKKRWAAWDSVGPFERFERMSGLGKRIKDAFLSTKITGSHVGSNIGNGTFRDSRFYILVGAGKEDRPVLMRDLNMRRAQALGQKYDDTAVTEALAEAKTARSPWAQIGYRLLWLFGSLLICMAVGTAVSGFAVRQYGADPKTCSACTLIGSLLISVIVARVMAAKKYPRS